MCMSCWQPVLWYYLSSSFLSINSHVLIRNYHNLYYQSIMFLTTSWCQQHSISVASSGQNFRHEVIVCIAPLPTYHSHNNINKMNSTYTKVRQLPGLPDLFCRHCTTLNNRKGEMTVHQTPTNRLSL